jgi:glycine C-acetyltransferase
MTSEAFFTHLKDQVNELAQAGLYKKERLIASAQGAHITSEKNDVINMCANNYLGLSNNRLLIDQAKTALDNYGFGLSSVRFICGTQTIHKELETKLSQFLGTEDTILYSSCFDANGGLFETILGPEDAVISDELNHASIIDGVRLCKAQRFRYKNNDMNDLEAQLKAASKCRFKLIATDGVFSMDGIIADLKNIRKLADKYGALLMVDDSHAVGFMGPGGRGTHDYCGLLGKIDIITGTLGKALGGASGGYTSGRKEVIDMLRQKSRPYLFSNSLAPCITATSIAVLDMLSTTGELREKLFQNTKWFRETMTKLGFEIIPGEHPIVPVMLRDAKLASTMADKLLKSGIYVVGFSFPVVPKDKARIRVQLSAAHSESDLRKAASAFEAVGKELKLLK